jgi:hypothetical protein
VRANNSGLLLIGQNRSRGEFGLTNQLVPDTVCGQNDMVFELASITGDRQPQRQTCVLE